MSRKGYSQLSELNKGRTDWKIKVKVIRNWRGSSFTGEVFKAFNVIVIDQQHSKFHAFIPTKCAQQHESSLREGTICFIKNFTVQKYKEDDKFRPVHDENQLIFSSDTIIKEVEDKNNTFAEHSFDFYDHSDLEDIADKTPYLIDVVGIIDNQDTVQLREIPTRQGRNQFQLKFTLTDGSSAVPVTFWDVMAQNFHQQLQQQEEQPVVVILTCARCGRWNKKLDISNVAATTFYFNSNHHSVRQIRKMISSEEFTQKELGKQKKKITELRNIEEIKNLGKEYIEANVVLHANIRYVDEEQPWMIFVCTKCKKKLSCEDPSFRCTHCKRRIPHPEKKFILNVVASDSTGPIEIQLEDREVRVLIGQTACQLFNEHKNWKTYPKRLKNLSKVDVTVKICIKEANIVQGDTLYRATNICRGFYIPDQQTQQPSEMEQSTIQGQPSTSTYHLEAMSELNFQ